MRRRRRSGDKNTYWTENMQNFQLYIRMCVCVCVCVCILYTKSVYKVIKTDCIYMILNQLYHLKDSSLKKLCTDIILQVCRLTLPSVGSSRMFLTMAITKLCFERLAQGHKSRKREGGVYDSPGLLFLSKKKLLFLYSIFITHFTRLSFHSLRIW